MENRNADVSRRFTNGMAISSVVLGPITLLTSIIPIMNFFALLLGVFGIAFGYFGLRQIKFSDGEMRGKGLAVTGILLNAAGTLLTVVILYLMLSAS